MRALCYNFYEKCFIFCRVLKISLTIDNTTTKCHMPIDNEIAQGCVA